MRGEADAIKVRRLLEEISRRSKGTGNVYLTGGASAALAGWRDRTVDVDLKLDPEPPGVFEALARIKDELDLNVELAAPDQFIPPLPGWRDRSPPIEAPGPVRFFHYDFRAQALAKIERGHSRDLDDVRAMLRLGLVDVQSLREAYVAIESDLVRYPAIDADTFRAKLETFLEAQT